MKQGREMTKFDLVWRRSSPRDAKRLLFLIILNSFMLVQYQLKAARPTSVRKFLLYQTVFFHLKRGKGMLTHLWPTIYFKYLPLFVLFREETMQMLTTRKTKKNFDTDICSFALKPTKVFLFFLRCGALNFISLSLIFH